MARAGDAKSRAPVCFEHFASKKWFHNFRNAGSAPWVRQFCQRKKLNSLRHQHFKIFLG
jgi:hypothetical protein